MIQSTRHSEINDSDAPVFVISVAARLAGMHAQTLRSYDREGLVSPGRTAGGGRRYSQRDVDLLREVQRLSQDERVNRAGIRRIIDLRTQEKELRQRVADMQAELLRLRTELFQARQDAANAAANAAGRWRGDLVPLPRTVTVLDRYARR